MYFFLFRVELMINDVSYMEENSILNPQYLLHQLLCLAFKVCNVWSAMLHIFCVALKTNTSWKTMWVDKMAKWSPCDFSSIGFNGSTLKGSWLCVVLQVKEVHSPYFQFQITSSHLWSPHYVFHLKVLIRETGTF